MNPTELSTSELSFINISERAYKYIRQFTIKSLEDAIIELLTNCTDAYKKTGFIERQIFIDCHDTNIIKVRDYALGLTSDELNQCFLQVGNYTASSDSRGFFSRGAKDISAIGNLYFNAVKDNKYSQCYLNTDAYGAITVADVDITEEIRNNIGIPDPQNGLEVAILLLPNFKNFDTAKLFNNLCKTAVLRDINTNSLNIIMFRCFDSNKTLISSQRITYEYPDAITILDMEYTVPNYPDATARFVVKKTNTFIDQPVKESQLEFGFLMKDNTTVYEVNTIDDKYRWNPSINYLYGYLKCDAIKTYLNDYDTNGTSDNNPYPIIDPSRLTGLNKMHPLIINLLSIPLVRLDLILREMNSSIASKSVNITDINDLLDELTKMGLDLLKDQNISINYIPSYDSNLIKAVQDDRAKYVTAEINYPLTDNYDIEEVEIDNYVKSELIDIGAPDSTFFFLNDYKELVQLQNLTPDEQNDPVDILKLLYDNGNVQLEKYPYIYSLNPNKELVKLYIFQKGLIDNLNLEKNLKIRQKLISIVFINDLNLQQRFVIDKTDGVTIKLNINNAMIRKYMTNKNIDDLNDFVSIENFTSTQSLVFTKELLIDVLTQLIVTNDIETNKLILDSTSGNNALKLFEHKSKVQTFIELSIDNIFQKYIDKNIDKKLINLNNTIVTIEHSVLNLVDASDPTVYNSLRNLSTLMKTNLTSVIE